MLPVGSGWKELGLWIPISCLYEYHWESACKRCKRQTDEHQFHGVQPGTPVLIPGPEGVKGDRKQNDVRYPQHHRGQPDLKAISRVTEHGRDQPGRERDDQSCGEGDDLLVCFHLVFNWGLESYKPHACVSPPSIKQVSLGILYQKLILMSSMKKVLNMALNIIKSLVHNLLLKNY